MLNIFIVGGTGFIGRHLVSECFKYENIKIKLLVRSIPKSGFQNSDRLELIEGNLLESCSFDKALLNSNIFVNLAYIGTKAYDNKLALKNIVDNVNKSKISRLIHCSTSAVTGFGGPSVIDEFYYPRPITDYQIVKYEFERGLVEHIDPLKKLCILRPTEVIGLGGSGLYPIIQKIAKAHEIVNYIKYVIIGSRRFNYVAVENVVAAIMTLIRLETHPKETLFLISQDDDPLNTYREVERLTYAILGRFMPPRLLPPLSKLLLEKLFLFFPYKSHPNRFYKCDNLKKLGYSEVVSISEAFENIISDYKDSCIHQ
jgi:nucleoside-diphosphate-sugar epimerase